jgi:hypothetical protein
MPAEIWVGQFSIVGGEAREEGPWTGLFPPRAGAGTHLYVLVEPAGAGSAEVCQPLAAAIGRLFQQQRLSVTGGILAALRGAHQQLRDWNQKSLRQHWVGAGATCLALQSGEAYVAQAGPSLAYCRQRARLLTVAPPGPPASEPIGTAEEFYPHFSRYPITTGDAMLLAGSSLTTAVGEDVVASLLSLSPQDVLPELYLRVRHLSEFAALLVAFLPSEAP